MKAPEPQEQHRWLQRLVGEWSWEFDAGEEGKHTGTERVRSLGGLWVLLESSGTTPGGETADSVITLGYDPQKERFVGTFIGSMMTNLWVYEGTLDAGGTVLTLDTEGPGFTPEAKMTKYQDIYEIRSDDERMLRSRSLGDDGEWHEFMTAIYRRKG